MFGRPEISNREAWEDHLKDLGQPEWWHSAGYKLNPQPITDTLLGFSLVLKSNAAELRIASRNYKEVGWHIGWKIFTNITLGRDHVAGSLTFEDQDLRVAFGLEEDKNFITDISMMSRFKASVANQGVYIRRGDYLNIPMPGTGLDGDPNISVLLGEQIRAAVRELLSRDRRSIREIPSNVRSRRATFAPGLHFKGYPYPSDT